MAIASIEIRRPASDVFTFVCTDHFVNHPRWDPAIVAVEGVAGPARRGTRATLVRRVGRRQLREACEVTTFEPSRAATFRSSSGPLTLEIRIRVGDQRGGVSQLTLHALVSARGPARVALPLVRRRIAGSLTRSAHAIKELIEREDGR